MLFMYIHTHSSDRCMAEKPQELGRLLSSVLENCAKANIKLIGSYVAAHEHTSYTILETDDMLKLQTALVPMTLWGDARLIPVVPNEMRPLFTKG